VAPYGNAGRDGETALQPNKETHFGCVAIVVRSTETPTVNAKAIPALYARSLAWLTVLAAIICGVSIILSNVLIDFVHGNPHRTRENTVEMIIMFPPLFGLIAVIGTVIVFALPQCFQALVSGALVRRFGGHSQAAVLLVLPLTAVITWYCFDYLVPDLGIYEGPDGQRYRHGLTAARYLATLACQMPVTVFSVAYAGTAGNSFHRKAVIFLALAAAMLAGGFWGYYLAEEQYQFL
jgi:hypothetical protein